MTDPRGHLHILVEGQTEETIVRNIIGPYLTSVGWWVRYSIITTKRPAGGSAYRGGVTSWTQIDKHVRRLLGDSQLAVLTTMLDYYAFPSEAPGMADRPQSRPTERIAHVEQALGQHFNDQRLIPHLVLHETEAWVFAAREQIGELLDNRNLSARLQADVDAAGGAEMVNDGPSTAPSKRLLRYCPGYAKPIDGPLAIAALGIDRLRAQCPHLDGWLARLTG